MYYIIVFAKLGLLFFLLFLGFFNWLYAREVTKVKDHTGIAMPGFLFKMLRINMLLSLLFAGLLLFSLVWNPTR